MGTYIIGNSIVLVKKNLRAYCIDRLGGSQRQDPGVFEDL
jgi:hypothetical protein